MRSVSVFGVTFMLLQVATSALPPAPPAVSSAVKNYSNCLSTSALKLEPSGADAADLFAAAQTECATEHVDLLYALQDHFGRTEDRSASAGHALNMIENLETGWRNDIRLGILKARAARK